MQKENKDFMVVDVFSQYMIVSPENGHVEMMDINRAKEVAEKEAQIGRIIDTGHTTKNLFETITENLDSLLNVIFDFLTDDEVKEFEKFGKFLGIAMDTYIYNKKGNDSIIGEFAVYDTETDDILRDEDYNFIHHSYSEIDGTVNNFYFVDITSNSYEILDILRNQYEIIYNISEVMSLKEEDYIDKIEESINNLLELYSSHQKSLP